MSKKIILVTGVSGFIASFVAQDLLEHGYKVRGTVRSLSSKEKYSHLFDLEGAKEDLEIVEADLLKDGSFDKHAEGVYSIFHTASPFFLGKDIDPQTELVDPALKGTRNVLNAAYKNKDTIKRVVLTSSIAAIMGNKEGTPPVYSEDDWNTVSSLTVNPYSYSKTLAEKEAWKLVKEWQEDDGKDNVFDLVTINPSLVTGPILHAKRVKKYGINELNTSCDIIRKYLIKGFNNEEKDKVMSVGDCFPLVDVRDVARAHRLGLETPEAGNKRHICSAGNGFWSEILPQLQKELEGCEKVSIVAKFDGVFEEEKKKAYVLCNDQIKERLKGFGEFITPYESVLATAKSLIDNDLLN